VSWGSFPHKDGRRSSIIRVAAERKKGDGVHFFHVVLHLFSGLESGQGKGERVKGIRIDKLNVLLVSPDALMGSYLPILIRWVEVKRPDVLPFLRADVRVRRISSERDAHRDHAAGKANVSHLDNRITLLEGIIVEIVKGLRIFWHRSHPGT